MKKGPGRWQAAWSFGSGLEHIEEAGAATEGSSRGLCLGSMGRHRQGERSRGGPAVPQQAHAFQWLTDVFTKHGVIGWTWRQSC